MDWNKLKQAGAQVADSAVRTAGQAHSYAELYAIHEQKPERDGEE